MLQQMAISHLILYITVKKAQGDYMKSVGDRLRKQEKAKWGDLWDWIKSKVIETFLLHRWVRDTNVHCSVNNEHNNNNNGGIRGLWCGDWCLCSEGLEKGKLSVLCHCQGMVIRPVILDAKRGQA